MLPCPFALNLEPLDVERSNSGFSKLGKIAHFLDDLEGCCGHPGGRGKMKKCLFWLIYGYFQGRAESAPPPHSSYIQKPRTIRVNELINNLNPTLVREGVFSIPPPKKLQLLQIILKS